jgi:hypothetical protein
MKALLAFFFIALSVFACVASVANVSLGASTVTADAGSSVIQITAVALLAVYEVIVRLVPTVDNISVIHAVVSFLKFLSGKLNVTKE